MEPATDRQPKHQNAPARDVTAAVNLCGTEPWQACLLRRVDTVFIPNNIASVVCLLVEVVLEFLSVITGHFEDISVFPNGRNTNGHWYHGGELDHQVQKPSVSTNIELAYPPPFQSSINQIPSPATLQQELAKVCQISTLKILAFRNCYQ